MHGSAPIRQVSQTCEKTHGNVRAVVPINAWLADVGG
jgi:hypothetical protein